MLAFLAAAVRDPMLRDMTPFVIAIPVGDSVTPSETANHLKEKYPSRFSPATLRSTAQNIGSSWTQAGYLTGKVNKKRSRPVVTPVATTFALLLGYLCGLRGRMLLDTIWTRMLDRSRAEIVDLATEASRQGWMNLKAVGPVIELQDILLQEISETIARQKQEDDGELRYQLCSLIFLIGQLPHQGPADAGVRADADTLT